ncbi:beta-lactamase-like protein [Microdochium trichocladiopsis]|uniref:Beta-lactamase-like protein n=1 Tax=Microdochium trichocladiopsis TaxID=1682393 RepID=A0A9P8YJJ5_9PEZI|nr:beta-lactamase-like protein [Microdochium trichocladiopsis]KAH7041183.1 beta-lactamase-like protein [Microdochium trichocladiopsis]
MCASDYAQHYPVMAVEPDHKGDSYTRDLKIPGITASATPADGPITPISPLSTTDNAPTAAPATTGTTLAGISPSLKEDRDVMRGFIGDLSPCVVKTAPGPMNPSGVAWNNDAYAFLSQPCPTDGTANPKLWEQSRRSAAQGLFEVVPNAVYQVRGLDLSNMTLIEGETGVIVVDPLITHECAAAALELYYKHRGNHRPVVAVMYSHSHADHYGGAAGILPAAHLDGTQTIPVIAPEHFMREVLSENVFAGPAMMRRGVSMYGARLPKGPRGQIGCGLGMTTSLGTTTIEAPNTIIRSTGEELTIDGVRFVFQMVPDTEAPAELNFHLPQHRALYIAECATYGLHNIVTLRGALVRDAKAWARYLDESMVLFCGGDGKDDEGMDKSDDAVAAAAAAGDINKSNSNDMTNDNEPKEAKTDVLFAGHLWPTFGAAAITRHLSEQRDLYTFLHDQTLRLMNQGLTGAEIAEVMTLPPGLEDRIHAQGYYGSVSHNVKGIYQRYMGWFDGNPAKLWQLPPRKEALRYAECLGGVDAVLRKAGEYIQRYSELGDVDDLRFAATLLDHAVAASDPGNNREARLALAGVYDTLGFGAENATWRNFYLTGAMILRAPPAIVQQQRQAMLSRPRFAPKASVEQWLDVLSVQLDGFAAGKEETCVVRIRVTDRKEAWRVNVSHGALTRREVTFALEEEEKQEQERGELVLSLEHRELFAVLATADVPIVQARANKQDCSAMLRILELCGVLPKRA